MEFRAAEEGDGDTTSWTRTGGYIVRNEETFGFLGWPLEAFHSSENAAA